MTILYKIFYAAILPLVSADVAAWHKGMYCLNGTKAGVNDENNNVPAKPLFKMKKSDWWMQNVTKCVDFPPADGDFLDLPANGEFTVEVATNRVFTSLSFDGAQATTFAGPLPDNVTDDTFGVCGGSTGKACSCISQPNIHTQNEDSAAGTAFAIAYNYNPMDVKPEELVVFTTVEHTPWRRLTTYQVPNLPKCPDAGCTCVWGWVPNGCGEPDIYMQPFRCRVTGTPGTTALSTAKPPVYCKANPSSCTSGAKQMIFWNQEEGNNVDFSDPSGTTSPGYNDGMGWTTGRQTDIFSIVSTQPNSGSDSKSLSSGAIAGIVVGIIALLGLLGLGFYFCIYRQRRHRRDMDQVKEGKGNDLIEPFIGGRTASSTRPTSPFSRGSTQITTSGLTILNAPGYHRKSPSHSTAIPSSQHTSPSEGTFPPLFSSSGRSPAGSKLEREIERQRVAEREGEGHSRLEGRSPDASSTQERHVDAGPVPSSPLQRRGSGRLPPAYGDIAR